ncbi:hypothetical protein [Campylobacter fetus]|uniref:Integral membrane protein n=1 Tax=Campylobacter fetus subsp. testudinum TaxID=1507806 RepID=A0AAX0HC06_CAMFE|nr:hypothetical protein [Campylobacter fetus]AVK80575.1 hypothetical protein C6B32_01575 [Campylobacter fetus subsp. testudinum]MPB72807.1 hypothetical protein [Campylobacter fetus]MPB76890.1 hypothetical protein [Campylobacter fetus]OCR85719.1 hypothetical protein CFT12S05168_03565 [Campylobacter fetus subsp. testudinum]OCR87526.1 hypothetical protein CFT13S00388_04090 [Campylobacter fetus subsp. testudinum]
MKFVAFVLALALGFGVWFIPAGIFLMVFKEATSNGQAVGTIIYMLILAGVVWALVFIVKKFYRFFLKKFGYEVKD